VLDLEVLILKLCAINALTTSAITPGEITTLDHELGNDAVELAALVVERFARLASALLASDEGTEVLGGLGDCLAKQAHHNTSRRLSSDSDIEENLVGDLGTLLNMYYSAKSERVSE
jgi:hypothetical protein